MDESIKEYLRRIGSKGGKAVAGTPQAKERAAKAAQATMGKTETETKEIMNCQRNEHHANVYGNLAEWED